MRILATVEHTGLGQLAFGTLTEHNEINLVEAISGLLTACATDLAEKNGGHVPDKIVFGRILKHYTTVESIKRVALMNTYRYFLAIESKPVATILISGQSGLMMPEHTHGVHQNYQARTTQANANKHAIFNTAVQKEYRRLGLARKILDMIVEHRDGLLLGNGLFARAEPTEHEVWSRLGFVHRPELDEYLIDPLSTERFPEVETFNSLYTCGCISKCTMDEHRKGKLKYFGFTRDF